MIFYQAKNASLRVHKFCKSIEEARSVIKEHSPNAKKIAGQTFPEMMFEEGWTLEKSVLDQTKEGILEALNAHSYALANTSGWVGDRDVVYVPKSVPSLEDQERMEDARLLADDVDRLSTELAERNRYIERLEKADGEVRKSQMCPNITPPIQYPDNFPENKTGKCLHCKKEIGWLLHIGN